MEVLQVIQKDMSKLICNINNHKRKLANDYNTSLRTEERIKPSVSSFEVKVTYLTTSKVLSHTRRLSHKSFGMEHIWLIIPGINLGYDK